MCGIAGYIGSRDLESHTLHSCLDLMKRRGPDHSACRSFKRKTGENIYLLHSRLSIIDLEERSNQPFQVGSKWIVFNGEIYNYLELRSELKNKYEFRTKSDTEVLLAGIEKNGWNILDRMEGMWSFVVYDEADGSLTLCRDRFGEKPLYIFRDQTGLYFGSEVKFIATLLGKKLEVDVEHLYRFMVHGYKTLYKANHQFFKGLEELSSSSILRLAPGKIEERKSYWKPRFIPQEDMTYADAVSGAREKLIRAVELRLRADVPLAFCMSGGVDSNSLISIAKNIFNYDVHGFTISNPDERYDEKEFVDYAVKELGVRHTYIPVNTKEFLPKLRTLIKQHDAPVYTITYFTHWMLEESIAKHGYKISISGTAADELFSGYYDHHLAYLAEMKANAEYYEASRKAWMQHIQPMVRNPHLRNPDLFIDDPDFRQHLLVDGDDFTKFLKKSWSEEFVETKFTNSLLRNRMLNEIFHEGVPVILHEDDLNSMFFSIENRSPFLDRQLFDFCYQIPSRHLIQNGHAKAVLRDSMKGIVPEKIITNRRKVGFNAGIFSFLDMRDPQVKSYLLDESPIYNHIRKDQIEQIVAKPELVNSESKFLFAFLASKIFLEEFAV
jgi:asparagine synthase (glutamine-hydrolysing)